jgi:hypothetical protein
MTYCILEKILCQSAIIGRWREKYFFTVKCYKNGRFMHGADRAENSRGCVNIKRLSHGVEEQYGSIES